MARINRSDVIQKAVNDLALSPSDDKIPNETLDKVQLVYSLNKHFSSFNIAGSSSATGTITLTLPTVSAGSEIYITALTFNMVKDATCDIATGRLGLNGTPDASNVSVSLLSIPVITLTADSVHLTMPLTYPLKMKPGTTLTITTTYTVGVMSRFCSVMGFITSSN